MDNPLVQPDPGLFIWTIITFLVLLGLLAKFAWRPLLKALESRQELIRKSLDDAQQAKADLERLQRQSAEIIRQAHVNAESIITKGRSDAERLGEEMRQKARDEANGIIRNAERQIQIETRRAMQEIRNEAVDLSVAIAAKLLERHVSKQDNERLINETLKQIEAGKSAGAV
jgi:F-type H+-transporting ATPase subunit b